MHRIAFRYPLLALGLALPLAGCEAGVGPEEGQTRVVLAAGTLESQASLALSALEAASADGRNGGRLSLATVDSIAVTVTRVEALPVGGADEGDGEQEGDGDGAPSASKGGGGDHSGSGKGKKGKGGAESDWVSLDVTAPTRINLLALPEDGLSLARAELPAGEYSHVRLYFLDPSITFSEEVTVGRTTYPADTRIYLEIPSGRIYVPTSGFSVGTDAGAEVKLVFDAAASIKKVTATGAGQVRMAPVLGGKHEEKKERRGKG